MSEPSPTRPPTPDPRSLDAKSTEKAYAAPRAINSHTAEPEKRPLGQPVRTESLVTPLIDGVVIQRAIGPGQNLGLLPAAVSNGVGSQVQKPLALVVVGIVLAPALILLVLPVLLELFSRTPVRGVIGDEAQPWMSD